MSTRVHPGTVAGLLSLLAALLVGSIWYIYLFVARERAAPFEALGYAFSPSNEARWWFIYLALLCLCSAAVGIAYLLNAGRCRSGALLLLAMVVALGISAFALVNWWLALFVALPAIWGYRCIHVA